MSLHTSRLSLDAAGHGERRYPDFDARFEHGNPRVEDEFLAEWLVRFLSAAAPR